MFMTNIYELRRSSVFSLSPKTTDRRFCDIDMLNSFHTVDGDGITLDIARYSQLQTRSAAPRIPLE